MDNIKLGKHAWLVVTNTSSSNITVGALTVAPGKSVTIGTYGTNDGHPGIWYNKEGYHRANYTDNRSYVMELTDVNLSALSAVVIFPDVDKWSYDNNCSTFASQIWNSLSSVKFSAGLVNTPRNLYNSIGKKSGYKTNMTIPYDGKVYYGGASPTVWSGK